MVIPIVVVNSRCEHVYDDCADIECNECGEKRDSMHTWVDADCDTPMTCKVCGATEGAALGHKPAEDDGNCSTPQGCVNCDQTVVENKEHTDADHDYTCDNPGCQVSAGAPEDKNDGIDLPIDRN